MQPTFQNRLSPFLLATVLFMPFLCTACGSSADSEAAAQAPPAIPVQLETLGKGTVQESTGFVGNLEAIQIAKVQPKASGRIGKILLQPGQVAKAGQAIMVLQPDQTLPESQGAIAGVNVAKADRASAVKQLDIAKARRDTAKAQLDSAKAKRDTAKSKLAVTADYVPRIQKLVKEGALEQLRLDQLLQDEIVAKNDVVAAENDIVAAANDLITAEEEVAAAELVIRQKDGGILQARSKANAALVGVRDRVITSPITGILDNLPVKLGDYVSPGQDPVATVAQINPLFLNIQVPAQRANQLTRGLRVRLLDPSSKERLADGNLTFVSPTVGTESQTILAKARFSNAGGKLRHGQNVQAQIIWQTYGGVLIPSTAIIRSGNLNFVYVVEEKDGKQIANIRPVELGALQGDRYQVTSGLRPGDRIAVSNILKLRDGAPVSPES